MRGCTPGNSRLGQLAGARAHRENSARARRGPSGSEIKVFWGAFFSKKVRPCPCPYRRAAQEEKLGKQGLCPAFPGRRSARKVASQKLGREPAVCPLRPPLEGTSPKGGGETWLPLRGRYVPVGRCPAADRGGSRDAGTAAAVTERASSRDAGAARQRRGPAPLCGPRKALFRLPHGRSPPPAHKKVSQTTP